MGKPRVGDVVEYMGKNGTDFQVEQANQKLKIGNRYEVFEIFSDQWGIYLYLQGVGRHSFKAEMFAFIGRKDEHK